MHNVPETYLPVLKRQWVDIVLAKRSTCAWLNCYQICCSPGHVTVRKPLSLFWITKKKLNSIVLPAVPAIHWWVAWDPQWTGDIPETWVWDLCYGSDKACKVSEDIGSLVEHGNLLVLCGWTTFYWHLMSIQSLNFPIKALATDPKNK